MNRVRLPAYEQLFGARAADLGLVVVRTFSWSGLVDEASASHPNYELARKTYSEAELLTRGMTALLRRRA
jgi:hypothetical protein